MSDEEQAMHLAADLAAIAPQDPALAFLRQKKGESSEVGRPLFRLVNNAGLWIVQDGTLVAPLADVPDAAFPDVRSLKSLEAAATIG